MRAYAAVIVLTLLATSSAALGQTRNHGPADDIEVVTVEHHYGLQILAADLVSLSLMGVGAAGDSKAIVATGGAVAMVGPLLVHAGNGNGQGAMLSMLLRPTLTLVGGMIGASSATCPEGEESCGLGEAAVGAAAGYLTAIAIDALVLARVERSERRSRLTPQVAVSSGGMRVGIGGTF